MSLLASPVDSGKYARLVRELNVQGELAQSLSAERGDIL